MSRSSELSSIGVLRVEEKERVVDAFKQNGYPLRFIQRHSRYSNLPQPVEDDRGPPRTSLTLPYISGLLETVGRRFEPLDIRVAFSSAQHPQMPASPSQGPCTHGLTHRRGVPNLAEPRSTASVNTDSFPIG